jgi:RNA polymerase sigma-70 factor (ECF subfamily)
MATGQGNSVIRHLRRAAFLHDAGEMTDGQLLERFLASREEAAFEVLLRRHAPMVLGVCRRILNDAHDAEDAFQAAFLVLIRKGSSLLSRQTVGNWLYGVAYHTALKARAAGWKRRTKERQAAMSRPETAVEETDHDLLPLLDQELDRLPEKYRDAVVLCELEGKSREEAARQLGVPVGTLSGRLTTARRMLARRLTRQGVALTGATVTTLLASSIVSASVPPALIGSTLKAAAAFAFGQSPATLVSVEVAALTERMLKSMLLVKLKLATAVLVAVSVLGGSAGVLAYQASRQKVATPVTNSLPPLPEPPSRDTESPPDPPRNVMPIADDKADARPSDKERLQGVWTPIGSMVNGEKKDPADAKLQMWKLRFDGDQVTIPDDRTARCILDTGKNPKRLDILGKDGTPMILAIYELEGDKLRVSFKKTNGRPDELDRPTDFDTAKNESVLIVLTRRSEP